MYYYGARYYDPALGRFIQPDTIVPNAGDAKSFDRYAYVNNNPLKYSDPTGHCPMGNNGKPALANSQNPEISECWRYANTILNLWDNTDYWSHRFTSKEVFSEMVSAPGLDSEFLKDELALYEQSDEYKAWDKKREEVIERRNKFRNEPGLSCYPWDCISIGLDFASLGISVGQTATAACTATGVGAPICGPATVALTGADMGVNGTAIAYETYKYTHGKSTTFDLSVKLADNGVKPVAKAAGFGVSSTPVVGIVYDLLNLGYDLVVAPFITTAGTVQSAR